MRPEAENTPYLPYAGPDGDASSVKTIKSLMQKEEQAIACASFCVVAFQIVNLLLVAMLSAALFFK